MLRQIYFLVSILRKKTKKETSGIQSVLGRRDFYKAVIEVATRKQDKIGHKNLKMCVKNDVAAILLNVTKKVEIDKWMSCLVLLF